MKVTMKELFNASYEALDVCLYAATIVANGNKEVRFYIWLNDTQNEFIMQQEFYTYETLFEVIRFAPLSDDDQIQLLKHINRYERYWKQTSDGIWRTDDEMLAYKEEIENTDLGLITDDGDNDLLVDYDNNQFAFPFLNGTLITANTGEDGITVNITQEDDEPKMGTFTDFENMLYGIAPIVQNNCGSNLEFHMFCGSLNDAFESNLDVEEIAEILLK